MSTKSRSRRAEQVRQMQAAAARKERVRRLAIAGTAGAVVVVVIVVLVVLKLTGAGTPSNNPAAAGGNAAQTAKVVSLIESVPKSTLDKVGPGTVSNPPKAITAPKLTADGKPRVLYVGAEYCPYCAATRWGIVQALSRFGAWSGLGLTSSTANDVYPNTPTLTFHGSSYSSQYLAFTGVETKDRAGNPLETLSAADSAVFEKYDSPPYVPEQGKLGIPFLDLGGSYMSSGTAYNPGILKGMTHVQIAHAMSNPSSPVAEAIDGEANIYTAAICSLTGNQPGAVCSAPGVKAAKSALGNG